MPRLFVDIIARFAQLQDAVNQIGNNVGRMASRLDRSLNAVGVNINRLIKGFIVLKGIQFGKEVLDNADRLATLSERLEIPIKTLNGLGFAAEQSGTDVETLATAFKNLEKTLSEIKSGKNADARRIFEDLGMKRAAEGAEDALEVFLQIADVFPRLAPNDRPRVLMDLMKKSAEELGPAMLRGRAGLEEFMRRANELAPDIEKNAKEAKAFNDQMNALGRGLRGIVLPILSGLIGPLTRFGDAMQRANGFIGTTLTLLRQLAQLPFELIFGREPSESVEEMQRLEEQVRKLRLESERFQNMGPLFRFFQGVNPQLTKRQLEDLDARLTRLRSKHGARDPNSPFFEFEGGAVPQEAPNLRGKDTTKKALDSRLADLDRAIDQERAKHEEYLSFLNGFAELGRVPYDELAEGTRLSLQTLVTNTQSLLDQQIAELRAFKEKNKNDPEAIIDANNKIAAAIQKKADVARQANIEGFEAGVKEATQTQAVKDQVELLTASLLELRGQTKEAFDIRFRIENRELRRDLTPAQRRDQDLLRDLQGAQIQARELDAEVARIQARLAADQERARTAQQVGAITDLEAIQRISTAHRRAAADVQVVLDKLNAIPENLRTRDIEAQSAALRLELEKLAQSSDLVRDKFESIFSDASSNTFIGIFEGRIRSLREAVNAFTDDLARAFNDIAARAISQQLFGRQGLFGDVPGFLSGLVPGGTNVEAGAGAKAAAAALGEVGISGNVAAPAIADVGISAELSSVFLNDFAFDVLFAGEMASLAADAFLEAATTAAATSVIPSAKGNVFDGVSRFARGDVFRAPTLFKFAHGGQLRTGVMGEEGPEAVMPLKRGRDGKLGVALTELAGGGVSVVNNFMLMTPADARTQAQIARQAGQGVARAMRRDG